MAITKLNYVDVAEKVISDLKKNSSRGYIELTTSQIRNILAMVSEIYNDVIHEEGETLSSNAQERLQYLRLHIVYSAGREPKVKKFVDSSNILKLISGIKDNKDNFILFCKYMEALVAYHRFYGGRD